MRQQSAVGHAQGAAIGQQYQLVRTDATTVELGEPLPLHAWPCVVDAHHAATGCVVVLGGKQTRAVGAERPVAEVMSALGQRQRTQRGTVLDTECQRIESGLAT